MYDYHDQVWAECGIRGGQREACSDTVDRCFCPRRTLASTATGHPNRGEDSRIRIIVLTRDAATSASTLMKTRHLRSADQSCQRLLSRLRWRSTSQKAAVLFAWTVVFSVSLVLSLIVCLRVPESYSKSGTTGVHEALRQAFREFTAGDNFANYYCHGGHPWKAADGFS